MLDRFTWFKQAAYLYKGDGVNVYIDPWGVTTPEKADVIFITHAHFDHYQPEEIQRLADKDTVVVAPRDVAKELGGNVKPVAPGDSLDVKGITVQAVPAYNAAEARLEMHPKANGWVGYVLGLGGTTYYHAGDTDHVPELDGIKTQVAFVPIGGTYTMDATEAAELVKKISPKLAVPMHYGFVVGSPSDAKRFADEAAPVEVRTMDPVHPFECD